MTATPTLDADPLAGRLAVRVSTACHVLDVGRTRLYELIEAGELESYLEGRDRRITARSIRAYLERKLGRAA